MFILSTCYENKIKSPFGCWYNFKNDSRRFCPSPFANLTLRPCLLRWPLYFLEISNMYLKWTISAPTPSQYLVFYISLFVKILTSLIQRYSIHPTGYSSKIPCRVPPLFWVTFGGYSVMQSDGNSFWEDVV